MTLTVRNAGAGAGCVWAAVPRPTRKRTAVNMNSFMVPPAGIVQRTQKYLKDYRDANCPGRCCCSFTSQGSLARAYSLLAYGSETKTKRPGKVASFHSARWGPHVSAAR